MTHAQGWQHHPRRHPAPDIGPARLSIVQVLSAVGSLLLGASVAIELGDAESRVELAVGTAAGLVFLLASALSRGPDAQVLTVRARLFAGAGLATLLAVAALWQATGHTTPHVLLLLIPVLLLFISARLASQEAAALRRQARIGELRSRLAGQEGERRRWAQELHDDTMQELAGVQVLLATAETTPDSDARTRAISQARELVGHQIQTLRRMIFQMRPLSLDTLGLAAALEDLARRGAESSGLDIDVHMGNMPHLPPATETAVYRIVQQALTNAIRHAHARRVTIEADPHPGGLHVAVRDDGCGDPIGAGYQAGYGLLGMRERAEAIGARLHLDTMSGTTVRMWVPLPEPATTHGRGHAGPRSNT